MATTALVQAHIDDDLKTSAERILAEEGIMLSDALRMLLIRTVRDNSTPSDLFTPNQDTLEALQEAREGKLPKYKDLASLKAYLNADD